MKKQILLLSIFILLAVNIGAQNLARTATYVSALNIYQEVNEVPQGYDGDLNTSIDVSDKTFCYFVIDLGASYSIYKLVFKWGANIPYELRVYNTTDGSGNCIINTLAQTGTQQIILSPVKNCRYIRVEFVSYGAFTFSANLKELEIYPFAPINYDLSCTSSSDLLKTIDNNESTYFQNSNAALSVTYQFFTQLKAVKTKIKSSINNLKINITGNGGNVEGYYNTLTTDEEFIIVSPGGISTVNVTYKDNSPIKLYNVAFEEIPLSNVSMPFQYDNNGNMTLRTILYSGGLKSAEAIDSTRVLPEKKQYSDDFSGTKIFVYPIPTKGMLTVDFKNFRDEDNVLIELYTVSGQKIMEKRTTAGLIDFDLGNRANGTYFLNIKVNTETHKWTIIKE
jgi:hypothetical protein